MNEFKKGDIVRTQHNEIGTIVAIEIRRDGDAVYYLDTVKDYYSLPAPGYTHYFEWEVYPLTKLELALYTLKNKEENE